MSLQWHAVLMESAVRAREPAAAFDGHVLACILAVALDEAGRGVASLTDATGLSSAELDGLLAARFASLDRGLLACDDAPAPAPETEEEMLRDLLLAEAATDLAPLFARLIARRALRPDHLWQDLGLFERAELGRLLARHFPRLHAGNTTNMRWKKYFYRRLCEAEGFSLCSAPSCAQCDDFRDCFGAEDGESRMAELRRTLDLAGAVAAE